jgi:hypothetical protein
MNKGSIIRSWSKEKIINSELWRNNTLKDILIIVVFAVLPFWKVGINGVQNKTDANYAFKPIERFMSSFYQWNDFSFGHSNILTFNLDNLDALFFLSLLDIIDVPIGVIQRMHLVSIFIISGISTYYVVKVFSPFSDVQSTRIAGVIAAIAYVYSPTKVMRLLQGDFGYLEVYAFFPLTFVFFYLGWKKVNEGDMKSAYSYSILFGVSSIFALTGHAPVMIIIMMFYFLCFIVLFAITPKKDKYLKFGLITFFITIGLNAYWLIPRIISLSQVVEIYRISKFQLLSQTYPEYLSIWKDKTEKIAPLQSLYAQPIYWEPLFSTDYFRYWISGFWSILAGTAKAIIAWSSILFRPRNKRLIIMYAITAFAVGVMMAGNTVIGKWYFYINYHIKPLNVLLNPHRITFLVSFGFAFLIGAGTAGIYEYLRQKTTVYKYVPIFATALILVSSFPFLSGNFGGFFIPVEVPEYYQAAGKFFASDPENFRILLVPDMDWLKRYSWGPVYDMVGIESDFFIKPVVQSRVSAGPETERNLLFKYFILNIIEGENTGRIGTTSHLPVLVSGIHEEASDLINNLLNIANIKYIVLAHDRSKLPSDAPKIDFNATPLKETLKKHKYLKLVKQFGALDIFLNERFLDNTVYVTDQFFQVQARGNPPWFGLENMYHTDFAPPRVFIIHQPPLQLGIPKFSGLRKIERNYFPIVSLKNWRENDLNKLEIIYGNFKVGNADGSKRLLGEGKDIPSYKGLIAFKLNGITLKNGKIDVIIKPEKTILPGATISVLIRYLDADNYVAVKLQDINMDGKWDEYRPILVRDGKEEKLIPEYWVPFPNATQDSIARITITFENHVVNAEVDLGNDGEIDASMSVFDGNPREGAIILRTERISNIWLDDIVVEKQQDYSIHEPRINYSYIKQNPSTYKVRMSANSPTAVILLTGFSPDWKAYEGDISWFETFIREPIHEKNHFLANGYANGWYIDKPGTRTITLFFEPQKYFNVGVLVLITTLVTSLLMYPRI